MRAVAILGAGTMGQGIAQVFASAGFATRVFDPLPKRSEEAVAAIGARLQALVEKGRMDPGDRQKTLGALTPVPQARQAVEGVELVLEAAPESMELKIDLLREVVPVAPREALLASNTSSLSLTELGARVGAPERTLGLHFFNPAPVMELVEVVWGLRTGDDAVAKALAFVQSIDKTAILVRDTPGFATSRLGVVLGAEAIRMLEGGVASANDIDRAMVLGYRHPMGPLQLTDLVGLDVRLAILEHLHREIGEAFRPPALLRQMVRAGKLGKKTGEGFYTWKDGVAHPREEAHRLIRA